MSGRIIHFIVFSELVSQNGGNIDLIDDIDFPFSAYNFGVPADKNTI